MYLCSFRFYFWLGCTVNVITFIELYLLLFVRAYCGICTQLYFWLGCTDNLVTFFIRLCLLLVRAQCGIIRLYFWLGCTDNAIKFIRLYLLLMRAVNLLIFIRIRLYLVRLLEYSDVLHCRKLTQFQYIVEWTTELQPVLPLVGFWRSCLQLEIAKS